MRRFHSYGPVDPSEHFAVERRALVDQCVQHLVGDPDTGGHFFTLWAPRQTGKTWLMRRAMEEIRARHGDRFLVGSLLMQGVMNDKDGPEVFFHNMPRVFRIGVGVEPPEPATWDAWMQIFAIERGLFDRPLILLIDEFDSLPPALIDELVGRFRAMYLDRQGYVLHGLALVGVRSVLGVESDRGSPFNVQRSLHVPNFTREEVESLFAQYEAESAQKVDPAVPAAVFEKTRGQPGLVGWFGELLTETYNPGKTEALTADVLLKVYHRAVHTEWNNTVLNMIKKARGPYRNEVVSLFTDPNVPFSLRQDWCAYLYQNGIIDHAAVPDSPTEEQVCRFSSPFVQTCLYATFTGDMFGDKGPILALEPGDLLADVLTPTGLCVPPLVERYRGYLKRLSARGIDPWKDQPRRRDLHLTEAVGHFHLYAWLRDAIGRRVVISPEFPTGNGKVDLVLRTRTGQLGLIEVKSYVDMFELEEGRAQAAAYAKKLGLEAATLAVFVPVPDDAVPPQLRGETVIDGVTVVTVTIGWF